MYNSDSEQSLSLLQSSMSSTGPGYVEVNPNNIISENYQVRKEYVALNSVIIFDNYLL